MTGRGQQRGDQIRRTVFIWRILLDGHLKPIKVFELKTCLMDTVRNEPELSIDLNGYRLRAIFFSEFIRG
jgi:hypothetical protein